MKEEESQSWWDGDLCERIEGQNVLHFGS
ncbi:hypothetical protein E2C01_015552 [Portunus trituberculatus]|uniref:Uncharacterized protein n=1 Tax=Portunus trituberculatus TaxID=210409 RepID=A0A5B7DNJ9_PORTR|nr:hypothetical protein [Portunus trituberculatus]